MTLDVLHNWTAIRSGPGITITHSTGKLVNVTGIGVIDGKVLATKADGAMVELAVPALAEQP